MTSLNISLPETLKKFVEEQTEQCGYSVKLMGGPAISVKTGSGARRKTGSSVARGTKYPQTGPKSTKNIGRRNTFGSPITKRNARENKLKYVVVHELATQDQEEMIEFYLNCKGPDLAVRYLQAVQRVFCCVSPINLISEVRVDPNFPALQGISMVPSHIAVSKTLGLLPRRTRNHRVHPECYMRVGISRRFWEYQLQGHLNVVYRRTNTDSVCYLPAAQFVPGQDTVCVAAQYKQVPSALSPSEIFCAQEAQPMPQGARWGGPCRRQTERSPPRARWDLATATKPTKWPWKPCAKRWTPCRWTAPS